MKRKGPVLREKKKNTTEGGGGGKKKRAPEKRGEIPSCKKKMLYAPGKRESQFRCWMWGEKKKGDFRKKVREGPRGKKKENLAAEGWLARARRRKGGGEESKRGKKAATWKCRHTEVQERQQRGKKKHPATFLARAPGPPARGAPQGGEVTKKKPRLSVVKSVGDCNAQSTK